MFYTMCVLLIAAGCGLTVLFGMLLIRFAVLSYTRKYPPTDIIVNVPLDQVYCERWVLWPEIDTRKSDWDPQHKFAIIINRFHGPDLDPPHNHMSWSASLAVSGAGYERSPGKKEKTLWPLTFRFRSSAVQHCIDSFKHAPLTTVFITGLNRDSKWGFWENGTFTEAKHFKSTKAFRQ